METDLYSFAFRGILSQKKPLTKPVTKSIPQKKLSFLSHWQKNFISMKSTANMSSNQKQ